jgi:hypothetical protein
MIRAAGCWFGEEWHALWKTATSQSATKSDNNFDAVVRALSQSPIPAACQDQNWRNEFASIWSQTAHRLRNLLHQDTLKAYYFDNDGRQVVACNFWPTPAADGVLEMGNYWPFGRPNTWWEKRPSYPLFLKQSELDTLLCENPAEKPGLPGAKMPELVAALRELNHLPNRTKQREALRKLPEFERYHLTDDVLREAEKQVPRKPGRQPPHREQ